MRKLIFTLVIVGLALNLYIKNGTEKSFASEENPIITISEIYASGVSSEEYIEVYNSGNTEVDFSKWKFFEADTNHNLTPFNNDGLLKPKEFAVIANNPDQFIQKFGDTGKIFDSTWGSLSLDGEKIGLKNDKNEFTDLLTYTPHTKDSLQKINLDSNDPGATNWMEATPTPHKENFLSEVTDPDATKMVEINATPNVEIKESTQLINTTEATKKVENVINKVETVYLPPNAEIKIQSGEVKGIDKLTINIDGSSSTDPQNSVLTFEWDFGDGYFYYNKNPPSHTFKTVGEFQIRLKIINKFGLFDIAYLDVEVEPSEEVVPKSETTEGSVKEESNTTETDPKTDKDIELKTVYDKLKLSELMPNPTGNDKGTEWVEIYNPNDFEVNLNGYYLDDIEEGGSSKQKLSDQTLLPHSYATITELKISINNSNEEIRLLDPNGNEIDFVTFEKSFEGQSYALVNNEWQWTTEPTPDHANILGEASENTQEGSKYKNGNLSSEIYITELLANPKGEDAKLEWIELYNAGNENINLGNWVIDDKEGGSKPYTIPDTYTIRANQFLVLERTETKISLDNKNEIIRLFNFEEELQDEVTYDNAKENLSYTKMRITENGKVIDEWKFSGEITKGEKNPSFSKITGKVESIAENLILIKAQTFEIDEMNELNQAILKPGNIVSITHDNGNKVKEFSLIEENFEVVEIEKDKKNNMPFYILSALGILLFIVNLFKKAKIQKETDYK